MVLDSLTAGAQHIEDRINEIAQGAFARRAAEQLRQQIPFVIGQVVSV